MSKFSARLWKEQIIFWSRCVPTSPTCWVGFFSASSLKQQSTSSNVPPIGQIILIPSQPVFALTPLVLCAKANVIVYKWLAAGRWFSPGTLVSSTNKTDHHDTTEILLKGIKYHNPNPEYPVITTSIFFVTHTVQ